MIASVLVFIGVKVRGNRRRDRVIIDYVDAGVPIPQQRPDQEFVNNLSNPLNAASERRIYRFGPYGLDPHTRVLLRDGEPIHLTRKAVETLLVLVENSPNVVTKEELFAAIWPDRVVDDHNLAQNIATARKILGVEPGSPGYIETFPGRGYRVLGPVVIEPAAATAPSSSPLAPGPDPEPVTPSAPSRRSAWGLGTILAAIAIGTAYLLLRPPTDQLEPPRVGPLFRLGGKQYQPAISPDGRAVAFLWKRETPEPQRIWLLGLKDATPRELTGEPGEYSSPAWSPDGRSIACLRFRGDTGEIVVIPLGGGKERIVGQTLPTRFGLAFRHLDWSLDGRWLAVDDAPSPSFPLAIYIVNASTGGTHPREQSRRSDPGRRGASLLARR
jgi:DNA-binding winged helix-turn-helix (wHTH) protein